MKYINLGGSELKASAIALGCMRISEMSVNEVSALVNKCLELDINFFDHADIYGGGVCEELFGKVLKEKPGLRDEMFIQSKCGIRQGFFDFSKEHIQSSTEKILKRLDIDRLDVLLLHRPDTLMEPEEVASAFDSLQSRGMVRYFGVSNMHPAHIIFLENVLNQKLIVNQLQFGPAHTGMVDNGICVNMRIDQGIDRDGCVLEFCRTKNITIQTWSSLQHGMIEGTFLNNEKFPNLNKVLEKIANEKGITVAAAAIAWILRHPAKMQVIPGTTNIAHITDLTKAIDVEISRQEWYEIYLANGNILP